MAQEVKIIYGTPAVAQGETHSAEPPQPSIHRAAAPSPANDRHFVPTGCLTAQNDCHFTLSKPSLPQNLRHFAMPEAAVWQNDRHFTQPETGLPANNRRFAKPKRRQVKTTVVPGYRAAFWGKKSIFQAGSIVVKGLAGLKSGGQAAGSRLPLIFHYYELPSPHPRRLRLWLFTDSTAAAENPPLKTHSANRRTFLSNY